MNYMEQVAHMLGVEIGEIFYIKNSYYKYRLTDKGVDYYDGLYGSWIECQDRLLYLLTGKDEIIKRPILDDIERRYLSNVIKPFRDEIVHITKSEWCKEEYITIAFKKDEDMNFPSFEKGTMYKGMEANKQYSLEDLGL